MSENTQCATSEGSCPCRRWQCRLGELCTICGAVVRVLWRCPELIWYSLPRSWRGGYRSPWERSAHSSK